jgi:hypothetical protein
MHGTRLLFDGGGRGRRCSNSGSFRVLGNRTSVPQESNEQLTRLALYKISPSKKDTAEKYFSRRCLQLWNGSYDAFAY